MPFVTAANIDGSRSRHIDRKSGRVSDDGNQGEAARRLGTDDQPEASETWYGDDRIADDAQTAQSLYSNQQPRTFDRGHQVRREDPVWGDDETAERANADTFHFTNCCPQHWKFNEQARYWAGIENYVLDNARAERTRVSVFTGPVLAPSDPRYRDVRVPLQFFKVIAWVEDGEPRARAFLASQAELLTNLPERAEAFDDVGKVREYLTTVQEIEEITGLDFGPLRDHDTHSPESLEASLRPLRSQADILEA
jgi:endonuclease G